MDCPFCTLSGERIVQCDELTVTIRDGFPVSPGHTLIIPRRHVKSFFQTTPDEQQALLNALAVARNFLLKEFSPDGFNIGINDGVAAGQTVMHLHIHLIPRYQGDIENPRGGVRWIFQDKADYWTAK